MLISVVVLKRRGSHFCHLGVSSWRWEGLLLLVYVFDKSVRFPMKMVPKQMEKASLPRFGLALHVHGLNARSWLLRCPKMWFLSGRRIGCWCFGVRRSLTFSFSLWSAVLFQPFSRQSWVSDVFWLPFYFLAWKLSRRPHSLVPCLPWCSVLVLASTFRGVPFSAHSNVMVSKNMTQAGTPSCECARFPSVMESHHPANMTCDASRSMGPNGSCFSLHIIDILFSLTKTLLTLLIHHRPMLLLAWCEMDFPAANAAQKINSIWSL